MSIVEVTLATEAQYSQSELAIGHNAHRNADRQVRVSEFSVHCCQEAVGAAAATTQDTRVITVSRAVADPRLLQRFGHSEQIWGAG